MVNLGLPPKSKVRLYWLGTGEDYRINTESGWGGDLRRRLWLTPSTLLPRMVSDAAT